MKKTLAILLSVLMVLSMAALGVSAAEATPVASAADFAAMAADGNYKLTADITIDTSYGAADTVDALVTFTGTFDGDGHTITTTAPLFAQLGGTVKNVIINGAIVKEGTANNALSYAGAVAGHGAKNSTIVLENVQNNASVTFAYRGAGFIGQVSDGATLTVKNCVNNGKVSGGNMVGGLIGYMQGKTAVFENCVNNGDVEIDVTRSLTGLAGGIIGRFGGDNALNASNDRAITINNCLNTGNVTATSQVAGIMAVVRGCYTTIKNCTNKGTILSRFTADNKGTSDAAGILGATGTEKGYYSIITIDKCVNEGNVTSQNARAAGIVGYVWCGNYEDTYMYAALTNCVNKGAIAGGSFVSQMLAYTNDARGMDEGKKQNTKIQGVALGSVARAAETTRLETPDENGKNGTYFSIVGVSSSAYGLNYDYDLVIADTDKSDWVSYSEGTPDNRHAISEKPDTIKFVDAATAQTALKALGTVGYVAPTADDPTTPDAPATGDTAMIAVVLCAVSLLGMGIALKSRKA